MPVHSKKQKRELKIKRERERRMKERKERERDGKEKKPEAAGPPWLDGREGMFWEALSKLVPTIGTST